MLESLKNEVFEANLDLWKSGLVIDTWGNVSGFDTSRRLVVIKPSGIAYETMKPEDMVVISLDGDLIEGTLRPSSDAPTHLWLYRHFSQLGGIVHTHSEWATAWAQTGRAIPPYGTTHADYFHGAVPCTRVLTKEEVNGNYEENTGKVICETFATLDPRAIPAVLCAGHGPFAWGNSPANAVHNAAVLEQVAKFAAHSEQIFSALSQTPSYLQDKHYFRKHGKNAYYGQ